MGRAKARWPKDWSVADLLRDLGGVAPERIRLSPAPGTAREEDVTWLDDHEDRLYELVDSVLVEKVTGLMKSSVGVQIGTRLSEFVGAAGLGFVVGAAGALKLKPGLVRIPDVSFISWDRVPSRTVPDEPIPLLAPDLAVEVLGLGNTPGEVARKLSEYFSHGVTLVWLVNFEQRHIDLHTSPGEFTRVGQKEILTGAPVLPGFRVPVRDLFADLPRAKRPAAPKKGRKKRRA